jgi:hypothetical protein
MQPTQTTGPDSPNAGDDQPAWRAWLPSRGNVLFITVVAAALFFYVRTAGAVPSGSPSASSTSVIPYQGRLADTNGDSLDGSYAMTFKLYNLASGGSAIWTETWSGGNSISVTNGLFNVLLGTLTPVSATTFANHNSLWLGVTVGADSEMAPRVQLGSTPFSMQALVVPDGSISAAKLAPDVQFKLRGWERDESSTSNPAQPFESDLLLQHGYAQHIVTGAEVITTYFDHAISFPTPFKLGTRPTVVISFAGESPTASDVPKGVSANGDGSTAGRIFSTSSTGFVLRGQGPNVDRRVVFYWIAIGQAP